MSEYEPFPPQREVSSAYNAVIQFNKALIEKALSIENARIMLGETDPKLVPVIDEFNKNGLIPGRREELFAGFAGKHISTLADIGIVLDTAPTGTLTTITEMKIVERAVPELMDPLSYAAYLRKITSNKPLRSTAHIHLVTDVVDHIYYKLSNNERKIRKQFDAELLDEDIVRGLYAQRFTPITQFLAIKPVYDKAKLHRFSDYYGQVDKWAEPYRKKPI